MTQTENEGKMSWNGKTVYFIGIGGIGMSAIARWFNAKGARVSGYDKTPTALTNELEKEGIRIHFEDDPRFLPEQVDLVVYTPAIPADHRELAVCRERNLQVVKRSEALTMITESSFNICIAGTHGKTTITTLTAHLLRHTGYGCNAFLGGIAVNYDTNFWSSEKNVSVVEADEYDRSFLRLSPDIAVITAMDADHLDIYGTAEEMEKAFVSFSKKLKAGGIMLYRFGLKHGRELGGDSKIAYSLQNDAADVYAEHIRMRDGGYEFDLNLGDEKIEGLQLFMGGMHNVENCVAAVAIAASLEIDHEAIKKAVAAFKGVKRRFEYLIRNQRLVFIDDYAHHPEELKAVITGAKTLFPDRRCTVIFQPHLYSRTRDLAEGFADVLSMAEETVLLPIYPAREEPIAGVSSEMILEKMTSDEKSVKNKEELLKWLEEHFARNLNREFGEILIMAGAGDIDTLAQPAKKLLERLV